MFKKIMAILVPALAVMMLASVVLASGPPDEGSYPPASTFADEVYTGGVCDISYRIIFSDDGRTFEVRAGAGGFDHAKGTAEEVYGRVDGEVVNNRIELDSYAYNNDLHQLMVGNFDDATGQGATLDFYLWDFRPGKEWCFGTLNLSRQ